MPVPERGLRRLVRAAPALALLLLSLAAFADPPAPAPAPWLDYQIVMWQGQTPRQWVALKSIGITAGEVHLPDRARPALLPRDEMAPLLAAHLRWYVENIATDFYAAYHRWFPDRPVNWRFQETKKFFRDHPGDPHAFWRDPSLSDARWLEAIRNRLTQVVRAQHSYHPLYYDLGDETGIAELSIFWDFDLSPASLAGMRGWLETRYPSLAALNREWGTHFADWRSVAPMTTQQAMARDDGNYAAWSDFKAWMDASFARALRAGSDAVHAADPAALAGIEGAQIPGWGGYDYARLSRAVDVMEVYDGGGNLEIARSLNPGLVLLTTASGGGAREVHDIWREALRGTRGVILWDPDHQFAREDGTLGPRGLADRAVFERLRGGLGAFLINSRRQYDPVAILYSPESLRLQWLLDWRGQGDAWATRDIAASYEDPNPARDAMMEYADALERLGLHPRFLAPAQLSQGVLRRGGYRALILPHALALSDKEADEIRRFSAQSGTVIADFIPGQFDAHGRARAVSPLADLFAAPRGKTALSGASQLRDRLRQAGVRPMIALATPAGEPIRDVDTDAFRNGGVRLLALQRRWPAATPSSQADKFAEARERVVVTLPRAAYVYDVLAGKALGYGQRFTLDLDPVTPCLLAYAEERLPAPAIAGPQRLRRGETGTYTIGFAGAGHETRPVLHSDVIDPGGRVAPDRSVNLIGDGGAMHLELTLGRGAPAGLWHVRVTDPLTGAQVMVAVEVVP